MIYFVIIFVACSALILGYIFGQAFGKSKMIDGMMAFMDGNVEYLEAEKEEILDTLDMIAKGEM